MSFFYQFAFHGFVCSIQRDFYLKENKGRAGGKEEERREGRVLGESVMLGASLEKPRHSVNGVSTHTKVTAGID